MPVPLKLGCVSVIRMKLRVLLVPLLAFALIPTVVETAQAQAVERPTREDVRVYGQYRTWFFSSETFSEDTRPSSLSNAHDPYRAHLIAEGASEAEADKHIAVLEKWKPADFTVAFWNARLTAENPRFNTQPNQFLVRMASRLEPGRALDVGMGQGRNSIYLAQQGWEVTGYDPADLAVESARKQAARLGVKLNAVVARGSEFDWGEDRWDLIVLSYVGAREYADRVRRSLRPGGVVLIESFHRDATEGRSIGRAAVFESNELIELFGGFRILQYEDVEDVSDFVSRDEPLCCIVRLLAQKSVSD